MQLVNEKQIVAEYNSGIVSYGEAYRRLSDMGYSDNDIGDLIKEFKSVRYPKASSHRPTPKNHRWWGTSDIPPGGMVWAHKSPWWYSDKEYRYDTMNVLDNPEAQLAFQTLEKNLRRYEFLSMEKAESERKAESVQQDLLEGESEMAPRQAGSLWAEMNRHKEDALELLKKEIF